MEFHTIKSVTPLKDMILEVVFNNGICKKYDMKNLINKYKVFKNLENDELFNKARVDMGGYGIIWNEEIDLSSEEIWSNGY
ncbi:MAG: DUF2442 domain-containing protein [Clostridia bacterium]|nr:DUF2442 domain-containing protein [Clostridia bacterium]